MTAQVNDKPPNADVRFRGPRWIDLAALLMIVSAVVILVWFGHAASTVVIAASEFVAVAFYAWLRQRI